VAAVPVGTGTILPGAPEVQIKLPLAYPIGEPANGPNSADLLHGIVQRREGGRLRAIGLSDVCTAERAMIAMSDAFPVSTCSADLFRFEQRRGTPLDVVDLALTTHDDVVRNVPIPFGLFNALDLGIDGSRRSRPMGSSAHTGCQRKSDLRDHGDASRRPLYRTSFERRN
jgi:hypothetical protein